jgi:hypothetical protein
VKIAFAQVIKSSGPILSWKMGLCTQANGSKELVLGRVEVGSSGLMEVYMKATGYRIKLTGGVGSFIRTEMFMTDSGSKIKRTDMASTRISTALATRVNGSMINKMAKVTRHGPMAPVTRASTRMARSMAKVSSRGRMGAFMRVVFMTTTFKGSGSIIGRTVGSSKETGSITKCMDMVCLNGLMAGNTKATTKMIKRKATEFSPGQTVVGTMVRG